jgi:phosphate transport system substrate-binding protein
MHTSRDARLSRILLPTFVVLSLAVARCGGSASGATAGNALPDPASLSGALTVDGSRTVLPVSTALAEAFRKQYPHVRVTVSGSDTGPGFERLCRGEIEISDASRPINAAELQACASQGIQLVELPIAFDSLTVVVSRTNTFAECLTIAELKKMWEPAADGQVTRWDQIRSGFPAKPIALFGPGAGSGTYDYFTLAVVGANSSSRKDYKANADLGVAVDGVAGDADALGFLGFAYYAANKDRLKALAVDAGHGCVAPGAETVADATYQPLSRPLLVYVSKAALSRPEVQAFADFYVDPDAQPVVREVGYVPLPPAILLSVGRRLDDETTGSVFGGRGSVLGVTAGTFQDEDRIKNALVR